MQTTAPEVEVTAVADTEQREEVERQPPWRKQITLRGAVASVVIGVTYSVIAMKINLSTGLSPNLNISAALLAFVFMRSWTRVLHRAGIVAAPFTPQENTMIQTCSVACFSIAVGGGFGSYILALSKKEYELAGESTEGNTPGSYKEPALGWMAVYMFLVCFVGLFVLVPLRKVLIIDYKLIFPSGTATSVLINGFHSRGDKLAMKQVRGFLKYFSMSFLWGFFQWFFSGKGSCGFSQFPTFGLRARKQTFYFDFSMTFVGTGMICPHLVNLSLLLGSVLSWGLLWPIISKFEGKWYPENLPENSMKGLNGYKTFLSVALILGDGMYNFMKVLLITFVNVRSRLAKKSLTAEKTATLEELKRNEIFDREGIPMWVGLAGYVVFSAVSVAALPALFPELKWYYIVVADALAPSLAFCNAYGAGLTDINLAYNYGKLALFVLAAMAGKRSGVVAGLVGCGLIKSVVSVACILMQDLKTAHLTFTSPRSMFLGQLAGTALGCLAGPLSFLLFYTAFDVGNPNGSFKAPFGIIYRNMAILGVEGVSALPGHCLEMCYGFLALGVAMNVVKDFSPRRVGRWVPIPMAMALPFLVGAYFGVDQCVGTLLVFAWQKLDAGKAELMVPAVASGLICGEGLWIVPASILALAKINPPICMTFLAS